MAALAAPTLAGVSGSSAANSSAGTIASAAASGSGRPSASSATATGRLRRRAEDRQRDEHGLLPVGHRGCDRRERGKQRQTRRSQLARASAARVAIRTPCTSPRHPTIRRGAEQGSARQRALPERHRRGGREQTSSPASPPRTWHRPARAEAAPARTIACRQSRPHEAGAAAKSTPARQSNLVSPSRATEPAPSMAWARRGQANTMLPTVRETEEESNTRRSPKPTGCVPLGDTPCRLSFAPRA